MLALPIANVKDFGAPSDGSSFADRAFQLAMDATQPGGKLYVPYGSYKFENPLTFTKPLTLESHGTFLAAHGKQAIVLPPQASGSKITGAYLVCLHSDSDIDSVGVHLLDSVGVVIENLHTVDFFGYGLLADDSKDVVVDRFSAAHHYYGGAMFYSTGNVLVRSSKARDIFGGSTQSAYGFQFTSRRGQGPDHVNATPSWNCEVLDSEVSDLQWSAFGTHGGSNIRFRRCVADRCAIGFDITYLPGDEPDEDEPPVGFEITDCEADWGASDRDLAMRGISISGSPSAPAMGSVTRTRVSRHGAMNNSNEGAILTQRTMGVRLTDVTVADPVNYGVTAYLDNQDLLIERPHIYDVHSPMENANPIGVELRGGNNQVDVLGGHIHSYLRTPGDWVMLHALRATERMGNRLRYQGVQFGPTHFAPVSIPVGYGGEIT